MQENKMAIKENKRPLIIDSAVGLTALKLYIENGNMDVGQVTVRHLIFSELIVQIRTGKGLDDAKKVFELCFGNKNTIENGKGDEVYVSPLKDAHYVDEFNVHCTKISPRLADLVYKAVKNMRITEENVINACMDLITCGRMYQELTIDAAKTMFNVNIPYGKDMAHCHLNSRDNTEEDFNVRCNWKFMNSTEEEKNNIIRKEIRDQINNYSTKNQWKRFGNVNYILNKNDSKTQREKRGQDNIYVHHVSDFQHFIRNDLLSKCLDFASEMMEEKQEFSDKIMGEIASAMNRPEVKAARDIAIFFHDAFRTINSYQTKAIASANKRYPKKSSALEEHIKGIKKDTKIAMQALTNQFRIEFKKLGLSERDTILVMLHVVFSEGNNSSYAHMLLEQEFFKFAIDCYAGTDNEILYTEDKLIHCDFNEGDTVHFEAGKAQGYGSAVAYAVVPLCGDFIIRKNEFGKFVASQKLSDLVTAPPIDDNKLVFITKPGGGKDGYTSRHMQEITKILTTPGTRVTLTPYLRSDKSVHDAIVVNNRVIGSFRCSYAINGVAINSESLTKAYLYKEGTVDHIIVSHQTDNLGDIAFVVLKDVKTVPPPKIIGNDIDEFRKTSFQNMMKKIQETKATGIDIFSHRFKLLSDDNENKDIDNITIPNAETVTMKLPKTKFIDITQSDDIGNIIIPVKKKEETVKITMKQKFGDYTIMF